MCRPDGRHVFFKGKVQMITYLRKTKSTGNHRQAGGRIKGAF
jgi:acylphosphatase